ncbi:pro-epidermal growth factor-like [Dendronephthya gigantea]|uniref:pro-epidermal growth factor-like n=1 Tax=Dendronephthya gigantea TaxID=151771 RepID=UPI00106B125C|nr:pro-epidermal growth factor-like [Dendronephthya gigantea]
MKLDGSDSRLLLDVIRIKRFSVDDIQQKIYYINSATDYTNSANFNGSDSKIVLGAGHDDLTDIQVDPLRQLLFFAADNSVQRDLVVYNISSGVLRTLYNANSSSIRLTIDRLNEIIYWISYNADGESFILRKTDYSGNTTVITSSFGRSGKPAITQIGNYYYVLDSPQSIIRKYDKATDTVVQNITVFSGAADIIGTNDLNECNESPSPCDPKAECRNYLAGFSCECMSGYTGNGTICEDINECNATGANLCSDESFCVNEDGRYRCDCRPGYNYNGTHCIDINECNTTDAVCHRNATCTNNIGSYSCACDPGFSGNGTICEDLKCYIDGIYLATTTEIYIVSNGGSETNTLTSATNAKLEYDALTKRMLYYTDEDFTLYTMKLDGSNKTKISSNIRMNAFTIDYDSRAIYYISTVDNSISGFPMSNSLNIEVLIANDGVLKDLDIDTSSRLLFFSKSDNNGDIAQYNLTSKTASQIHPKLGFPEDVSVDGRKQVVYWTNFVSNTAAYEIRKSYYNGTTVVLKSFPGSSTHLKLAQGERYLYVLNPSTSKLDVINKESEEVLVTYDVRSDTAAIAVAADVDECCLGGYCHMYATCTNVPQSYQCKCKTGFRGNDTYCEDINECENTTICHTNATCDNNLGSYTCTCNPGLSGDGKDTCIGKTIIILNEGLFYS